MSFEDARQHLFAVSDSKQAAESMVDSATETASSLDSLRLPIVNFDAQARQIQKTLKVPTPHSKVSGSSMNVEFEIVSRQRSVLPVIGAVMPLYTGGRIKARQEAAQAGIREASAGLTEVKNNLTMQLIQVYFGQQLAKLNLDIRVEVLRAMEKHYHNAKLLEREGIISASRRMQFEVARDEAIRAKIKAESDLSIIKVALSNLLHTSEVLPSTPLFVISEPVGNLSDFLDNALQASPILHQLQAKHDRSRQEVLLEKAKMLPEVSLFGQRNLYRDGASMTDPDWAVGLDMRYTLFSNVDRNASLNAAQKRSTSIEATTRQARNDIDTLTRQAFDELEATRTQFMLLESNIRQARENLRLQELGFREGKAISIDVVDANLALSRALLERSDAAYRFDVALAKLLLSSGQIERYHDFFKRADIIVTTTQ